MSQFAHLLFQIPQSSTFLQIRWFLPFKCCRPSRSHLSFPIQRFKVCTTTGRRKTKPTQQWPCWQDTWDSAVQTRAQTETQSDCSGAILFIPHLSCLAHLQSRAPSSHSTKRSRSMTATLGSVNTAEIMTQLRPRCLLLMLNRGTCFLAPHAKFLRRVQPLSRSSLSSLCHLVSSWLRKTKQTESGGNHCAVVSDTWLVVSGIHRFLSLSLSASYM